MQPEGAVACRLREPWLGAVGPTTGALDIAAVISLRYLSTQIAADATMEIDDTAATNGPSLPPVGRVDSPPSDGVPEHHLPAHTGGRWPS